MALPQYPSYALNPLLNKEKFFQLTPPSSIDRTSSLPVMPAEWLVMLENFCREEKSDLNKNCFDRHLSPFTINALSLSVGPSESLIEGLQLICRRLRGDLDPFLGPLSASNRVIIIAKLTEDIEACTDGFENRVKHIIKTFEIPGNLPQLIYEVRKGLVENISASLTGDIHTWNRFTKVAAAEGIGIKANFDKDFYPGNIQEQDIVYALEKEFKGKFTPFNLPILLVDQLRGVLFHRGYTGAKPQGYTLGEAERIGEQIKCYLSKELVERTDWQDFFIINEDDDFDIVIHDLNWNTIRKCFFQTLSQEDYFTQQPSQKDIVNLLDCACFSNLFSTDNHLIGIESQCFDENSVFHLKKIKTDFPTFWQNLRLGFQIDSDLTERLQLFFRELEKAPLTLATLKKIVCFFDLDLMSLMNDGSMLDLTTKLIQKKTDDYNILMSAASEHPKALNFILKFLAEHPSLMDTETLREMFLHKNKKAWNALMLAASSDPEALNLLLQAITDYPTLIDKETLREMFLQTDREGINVLMVAAFNNPSGLTFLLKFIIDNPALMDKKILREMFLQTDTIGMNALMIAAFNNPLGLNFLLKFLTDYPTLIDKEALQHMFSQKITVAQDVLQLTLRLLHQNGFLNAAMNLRQLFPVIKTHGLHAMIIAARFQPGGFKAMLKFAADHSELFDEEVLKQIMAKNTGHGWNFFVIKALLEKYLEGISNRKAQAITHSTRFFKHNFGYSTQEKEIAALELKEVLDTGLKEPEPIKSLISLRQSYPALSNGRLGRLFNLCHKVALDETALAEVRDIMNDSREEPPMLLEQNP